MSNKEEKINLGEDSLPVHVTAVFIALAGIGFLAFALYYIIYLPVPSIMLPLKTRVITVLGLENVKSGEVFVVIRGEEDVSVYAEPKEDSEEVGLIIPGLTYKLLEKSNDWYKIIIDNEKTEGWINEQFLLID